MLGEYVLLKNKNKFSIGYYSTTVSTAFWKKHINEKVENHWKKHKEKRPLIPALLRIKSTLFTVKLSDEKQGIRIG